MSILMIAVIYKPKRGDGVRILPFRQKSIAIKKATELYKKGFLSVRVVNITEVILYIPEN